VSRAHETFQGEYVRTRACFESRVIGEKVRRERRWTSAGATPARGKIIVKKKLAVAQLLKPDARAH